MVVKFNDPSPHLIPLQAPTWVPGAQAGHMRGEDPVLALQLGEAYALPWWIMKNHHVANLTLEGEAVLVTLCEACSTGCAFRPVVGGQVLTFVWTGRYRGSILIRDHQTGSLWAPFTGECLEGEHQGVQLEPLPMVQCTWAEWLETCPNTYVPDGKGETRLGHGSGQSPGSLEESFIGDAALARGGVDDRLAPNTMVLGVDAGSSARAYPLELLSRGPRALEDSVGGEPIAVFSRAGTLLAAAFSRRVGDMLLGFSARGPDIVDRETGSSWSLLARATGGPLEGTRLNFVRSYVEEWYAWAASHPDTEIYGSVAPPRLVPFEKSA